MPIKPETSSPTNADPSEPYLYEYAVIRFLPRVEREEFVNVGLIMMCKRRRWLKARFDINEPLLGLLDPAWNLELIKSQLESFMMVAQGKGCSPIASLEAHERFRWMTAVRSGCIATARPHPGHTTDLDATFESLFNELISRKTIANPAV